MQRKNDNTMLVLICILAFTIIVVLAARWLYRRTTPDAPPPVEVDSGCCGAHAVCEKEMLLNASNNVTYYDDEELDALAGIQPDEYTQEQTDMLAEVFYTLKEKDVPGWLRSLQLRRIELPEELRDEALLIVRERRGLQ